MMDTPIDAIQVGDRRRLEMGDIEGLAGSIRDHGLLHPVVIDDAGNLIAGGRRLAAARLLGWATIPTRAFGSLSEEERRALELEENVQRKDLRPYERSRTIVAVAATAAEIAKTEEFRGESPRNSHGGRPKEPGSLRDVAERTHIPEKTIRDAREHVAAVEAFPDVITPEMAQSQALAVARELRATAQPSARSMPKPRGDTKPKAEPHQLSPGAQWSKASHEIALLIRSIRAEVQGTAGAFDRRALLRAVETLRAELEELEAALEEGE